MVQLATRPFPKHIYRSLRVLLNSTLTRNEVGSFQTQTIHKIEGSKPCIYTLYTQNYINPYYCTNIDTFPYTHSFHINIPSFLHSYSNSILKFSSSIHVIFSFLFLLSSFLFSSSSSSSVFSLPFSKTKVRYLFWSYLYLILSPFYFTFSLFWSIPDHPIKGGNFLPFFFKPLVSSTIFFLSLFLYLSFITLWSSNSLLLLI